MGKLSFHWRSDWILCISDINFKFFPCSWYKWFGFGGRWLCLKILAFHRFAACMFRTWSYPPRIPLAHLFQQISSPGVGAELQEWRMVAHMAQSSCLMCSESLAHGNSYDHLVLSIKLLLTKTDILGQLCFVLFHREYKKNSLWFSDQMSSGLLHGYWRQEKPPPSPQHTHHFSIYSILVVIFRAFSF